MKKILSFILPIAIIFSLTGCKPPSDTVYLKPDLRKTVYLVKGSDEVDLSVEPKYEIRIDGNWYDADENGNLTPYGQSQKQQAEMQASSDDGGGGGGC